MHANESSKPILDYDILMKNVDENLNFYPENKAIKLVELASKFYNVDAKKIIATNGSDEGIDLCILSQVNYNDGVNGKIEWLMANTKIPNKNIYIVKTGKAKAKYANNQSLLIDDFGKNIESFVLAGGFGIKFESPGQARQALLELLG
jgi:hypothetical protein